MFNEGGYWERAAVGEFSQVMIRDKHPSPALAHEVTCTRSLILAYLDSDGRKVALVHQYLRPDGTLGGSGRPDPKPLLHEGALYTLRQKPK
jgi:hypothetical protein